MFDIRLWHPTVKLRGESEEELDKDNNIVQFLATATLDKGKTPQRWSTIPRSQAHGATYRISHNPPPQQPFPMNQVANSLIHRSTESPRSASTSLPSSSPQEPIRRVPVPPQPTQYLAEAPEPDIIGRNPREPNHISARGSSGFYHQLDGVQPPNNPREVDKSPAEPTEFSIEGHTFQFPFSSHDFVAKPLIEVEGDLPNIGEVVPLWTDQSFDTGVSSQFNPVELSADAPPVGEPIFRADSSMCPEIGSGFEAETMLPEEPNNMNPPSTALVRGNEYPWIPQGHNPRVTVSQAQFRHDISDQLFDPAEAEQSVQNANDQQSLAKVPTDQPVRKRTRSEARPEPMSHPLRGDDERDSAAQSATPHRHNHQSVLAIMHNQSVPPSSDPRDQDKYPPVPPARGHGTKATLAAREEQARHDSLQLVEGDSPISWLGDDYREPGLAIDPSSIGDMTGTQWSSEVILSPQVEWAIAQTGSSALNPQQQIVNVPGSGHPDSNDVPHQACSMPQIAIPRSSSSHNAAPDTGEPLDLGTPKSTQASGSKQRRKLLGKSQSGSNNLPKNRPEGPKNWGVEVMKKLTGLVGGSGNTMPISYSPEAMTRRCLDFMEQQNIPSNTGLDPFSSILVYVVGKWRGDEARIHAQSLEIKTLTGRKEKYKNELESTQGRLQVMTQHRDKLRTDITATEGRLKAIEKDLRGCRGSLAIQVQENKELQKWVQEVVATNEEVYKEGERRIREKDREIIRLQKRIASYGTGGFRFVSDDKFQGKMQAAAQTINNLVIYIARPAPESFDASLDETLFLRRNEPYLGNRIWPKFIFGICWGILKRGFFSAPLGFGVLGAEGDGYESLNHIRETLAVYDPITDMLEISNDKRTNEVRGFLFERLWADVAASATTPSAHSATGEKGAKGLPIYFHRNIDKVTDELVSVLTRCSANGLSPLALGLIQELVRDVGFLALEMATQRARVTLEFRVHGDVIEQDKYFKDEASGDSVIDAARVDLMIEPALTRLGNGKDRLTEQDVLRKGSFVAMRG